MTNIPGCVLKHIRERYANTHGTFKNLIVKFHDNSQPPLEILQIESERALQCIRQPPLDNPYGLQPSMFHYRIPKDVDFHTMNSGHVKKKYWLLYQETCLEFYNISSSESKLHFECDEIQPHDRLGYVQLCLDGEFFCFPDNKPLDAYEIKEGQIYDVNKVEYERNLLKKKFETWSNLSEEEKEKWQIKHYEKQLAFGLSEEDAWQTRIDSLSTLETQQFESIDREDLKCKHIIKYLVGH